MKALIDKCFKHVTVSKDLVFLSQTATELFDISSEQNIYEIIGARLKEITGDTIILINEYDRGKKTFRINSLKGLGEYTEKIISLLKKKPEEMSATLTDPKIMDVLSTGELFKGPDGLHELSLKTVPKIVCQTIENILNLGSIYTMGFVHRGELFGDAIIICRRGENEKLVAQKTLLIETFINQAVLALHRKKIELELHAKERRFKALIKHSSDSITILDKDGIQIHVSDVVEKMLGFKPSELINIPVIEDMIHPEDQPLTEAAFVEIVQKGHGSVQYRHKHKNGSWVYLEAWGTNQLDNPDIQGVVVNVRDITERKRVENALRETETRYRKMIENSPLGMHFYHLNYNKELIFISANPAADQILGIDHSQFFGKTIGEAFPALIQTELPDHYRDAAQKGILWSTDQILYKDNQITGAYEVKIFQTTQDNIAVVFFDVTERLQNEADKLSAQKIAGEHEKQALVGQVAGKMAHDFNNILGIIMGNTELSLLDCKEPDTKQTLELIYEQTIRGKNLTRNLVAFAKDQEPKQAFFRINEKIDLVINLMRKDLEGIELIKEASPGIPELLADPGMIEHALVNLIQNSIHALSMTNCPRITIRTYSRDNYICLEIEDNGCGISKGNLKNIYKPSFTLKGSNDITGSYKPNIKGTGYGMSNIKKYITQHKGLISIESKLNYGTKFIISLPIIEKELTHEEKAEIQTGHTSFGKYILLVEDETDIADVQYRILTQEPCNHKVDIARNGKMAMDLFERNTYDLISLDYILPGNINGMDIYNHIRSSDKTIPILFISGNIEFLESIKNLMKKDLSVDHLSKPCRNIDYLNTINKLMTG